MAAEAMRDDAATCPGLETIAAYLDHRLPEAERDRIARHLARCETCYFVFTEAAQTPTKAVHPVVEPVPVVPWWRRPAVVWTAGGALAAAASVLMAIQIGGLPWGARESAEFRALVAAVGSDRLIEPRVTGGFAYGPLRGPTRAGEPTDRQLSPDVVIAVAQIEKSATADRSARSLRDLGAAFLVTGDVDRAVTTLQEAADQPSADARTLSDLAAAYLARATRTNARDDLMKALAAAERAIGADPSLPEAWFNRAEALERQSPDKQARDAWLAYLKLDADSAWSSEARSKVAALDAVLKGGR